MKGGFYFLKERNRWMVWFPVNGKKVFVSTSKQGIIQQRAGIACGWEPKLVSGGKK